MDKVLMGKVNEILEERWDRRRGGGKYVVDEGKDGQPEGMSEGNIRREKVGNLKGKKGEGHDMMGKLKKKVKWLS